MIEKHLPAWWWCKSNPILCILQDADHILFHKRLHARRRLGWRWISNGKHGPVSLFIGNMHANSLERWTYRHHPEYFEDE